MADSQFPNQNTGDQSEIIAHPQISPAESEALLQPDPDRGRQKNPVTRFREPQTEGPQEIIDQSQSCPQQETGHKPLGGDGRRDHPKSRCRQVPDRGSS